MDRGIAVGSKICAKWEEQRRFEIHRRRVRDVRAVTDTSEPYALQMDHIRNNLKREQMLEERYSEIDHENRILLKKMSDIMKSQSSTPGMSSTQLGPQSLNRDFRKKELLRITRENQSILKRIQQAQPQINHVQFEIEHRQNREYVKNCAEFPQVRISKRPQALATSELLPLGSGEDNEHIPATARSGYPQDSPLGIEAPLEDALKYVLKEGMHIGSKYFLVEMATDGRALNISAYNGESTLELVVKEKTHRKLYRETNGDYALAAHCLSVNEDGTKLILDDFEGLGIKSAPNSARGLSSPPTLRGSSSLPPSARGEVGRAGKAAEGVRERTAAYLQGREAPPKIPRVRDSKAPSPLVRETPPRQSPSQAQVPAPTQTSPQPRAPLQPQAPAAPPKRPGRPSSAQKQRSERSKAVEEDELDADHMIVASTGKQEDEQDQQDCLASTVYSVYSCKPESAGSALACEVDFTSIGSPKVHLRGLTPPTR